MCVFSFKIMNLLIFFSKPFGDFFLNMSESQTHGLFKLKPPMFDFQFLDFISLYQVKCLLFSASL